MRNILPFDLRRNIYISFIEPYFNYCAQTWHFCNKSLAEKLEKVNERAIRFVFRDKHTTYQGRIYGEGARGAHLNPRDDLPFFNTTGILQKKKTMWFIGVEVEQETSAPPPKKNPGSAPAYEKLL